MRREVISACERGSFLGDFGGSAGWMVRWRFVLKIWNVDSSFGLAVKFDRADSCGV